MVGILAIVAGILVAAPAVGIGSPIFDLVDFEGEPVFTIFGDDQGALAAGAQGGAGSAGYSGDDFVAETLSVTALESGSEDRTAVDGFLRIYSSGVNPSSPTANPIQTVTVTDGQGSSSSALVSAKEQYRIVFEGNSTNTNYYDKDFGITSLASLSIGILNPNTGKMTIDIGSVDNVGTLDDILDETATDGKVNGQSVAVNTSGNEIIGAANTADTALTYDESDGDGQWYIDIEPSCSGANKVCKDAVLHFVHDLTNPPEGNEYSTITAQLRSGNNFNIPSDITDFWSNEVPIELGDMTAGMSGEYRLTFSVVEANEDANDDWTLRFDDLGEHLGKDVRLNTRASPDTVTYAGSQA